MDVYNGNREALKKLMGRGIGLVLYRVDQPIQEISKSPTCGLIVAVFGPGDGSPGVAWSLRLVTMPRNHLRVVEALMQVEPP